MKAKKYTNNFWTEGDYEKEYSTATDTYTTLPATFQTSGADVENYQFFGASSGVGEETENEISLDQFLQDMQPNTSLASSSDYVEYTLSPNTTYTLSSNYYAYGKGASWFLTLPNTAPSSSTNGITNNNHFQTVTTGNDGKLWVWGRVIESSTAMPPITEMGDEYYIMLTKGSTPPSSYIPYGYKFSILLTGGTSTSNYDLFIGDSKLYEDEYADFATQKVYKLKEVHKDTVTIDGVVWDILGYDHDTVYKSDNTLAQHSVTIQTHDCISELQFDAKEALFAFPEGLAAGTYHFTVSQQPWYAGDVGKIMQFTLANAIPAGGVIVLGNSYNATMIGSTISVYASCSATTATETATISEGSDGTDLGSVGNAILGNTNSIQRAFLGNNNYNESAIRQYLNSDGEAGTYWTPQNKWDRPPSWNTSTAGFLGGFNSDFVSAIGKASKRTAKNTASDGGGYIDTEEKVFLLSRTEVYGGANDSINEGTAYKYYSDYSNLFSAGTGTDSNRTKYRNNVAKYWLLRSPYTRYASNPFSVNQEGAISNGITASSVSGVAPAVCIPLDNINNDTYLQSLFLKPIDPPAPFPTLHTYIGENNLSVDTTVQPEKVVVTVAAWREIEGEKYQNGEWSDNNDT